MTPEQEWLNAFLKVMINWECAVAEGRTPPMTIPQMSSFIRDISRLTIGGLRCSHYIQITLTSEA